MTDAIFGLDTSRDDAARIMNRFIENKWVKIETALFRGKWFDYRFMNPVQATYLYAHEYTKAYKRAFSNNIDSTRADHVKPLNCETLFTVPEITEADNTPKLIEKKKKAIAYKKRTIAAIWKGRMVADAMGMPYDIFLDRAFHWTLRFWQQAHLPRPSHLYSDLVTDRATIDWETRQKDEFFYSTLPQYKNGAYRETTEFLQNNDRFNGTMLHAQNAHHEWLLDQCMNRRNGHAILAQMVFHDQVLPIEKVEARLDAHGFEHFMSFAESEPVIVRYN
jgi:hypothetical protein